MLFFIGSMITFNLIGGFLLAASAGMTLFGGYESVASLYEGFLELIGIYQTPDILAALSAESSSLAELPETGSFLELTVQQLGLEFHNFGFLLAPAWYACFATAFSIKRSLTELGLLSI